MFCDQNSIELESGLNYYRLSKAKFNAMELNFLTKFPSKTTMTDEQDDFWVDWSMHIGEVKMFHDHLCYAIETPWVLKATC